eukprot:TRINITY_DN14673_c0_g1_i2.p1 TRINITY_DN14673_c0_g1~~TRINITY_DN14673_c0_g1_i2.p1  ORF type:complete len:378 (+),score=89.47 TRINITY_DN14673_c0_g1_i2:254-1387(+)
MPGALASFLGAFLESSPEEVVPAPSCPLVLTAGRSAVQVSADATSAAVVATHGRRRGTAIRSAFQTVGGRAITKGAAIRSAFESVGDPAMRGLDETPKLRKKPEIRLMYQTPEVYSTNIGQWNNAKDGAKDPDGKGSKWACDYWLGDKMIGNKAKGMRHPEIVFNTNDVKFVNVHLEDLEDGTVYWHGKYALSEFGSPVAQILGRKKLTEKTLPVNMMDPDYRPFRKPCVAPDDPSVHHFDMSIRTDEGTYEDDSTFWGEQEGFDNFMKPEAHIGFDVQRMPLRRRNKTLGRTDNGVTFEETCKWEKEGDQCAHVGGLVHQDMYERAWIYGDENPLFNDQKFTNGDIVRALSQEEVVSLSAVNCVTCLSVLFKTTVV